MDNNPALPNSPAITPNPSLDPGFYLPKKPFWKSKKKIIPLALVLVIIAGAGIYLWQTGRLNIPSLRRTNQVDPKLLEKAKNETPSFINTSLKTESIPSTFDIKPTINPDGTVFDSNRFNTSWSLPGLTGHASVKYGNNSSPKDKNILIILSSPTKDLDSNSASALAKQHIILEPKGEWKCDSVNLQDQNNTQATICESFWSEDNIKKGVGVMSPLPNQQKTSIFYCEIYPNSKLNNWKSCNTYKAESGYL